MDEPLLRHGGSERGLYEIVFHVGEFFKGEPRVADRRFLDRVPIWFGIADQQVHCHVRRRAPPRYYGTYRGRRGRDETGHHRSGAR